MAKNLIPVIAKELGVEIGEEFEIKDFGRYRFTETQLECVDCNDNGSPSSFPLNSFLKAEIIKFPFEPKKGEEYWSYWQDWAVTNFRWSNEYVNEYFRKATGCVFRTKEKALAARPAKYKELTGKEWRE